MKNFFFFFGEREFREINSLVTSSVQLLLSRFFFTLWMKLESFFTNSSNYYVGIKLISQKISKWEDEAIPSKALIHTNLVNSCIIWVQIRIKSYPRVWLAFEARLSLEQAPQAPILKKAGFKAFFKEAIFTALLTCGQEWSDWLPDCWPGLPLVPSSSVVLSPKSWSSKFFFFFFPMIFLQKSPTHHFSIKIFCWPVFSKKSAVAENEPDSKTILQNKNTFSKRFFYSRFL